MHEHLCCIYERSCLWAFLHSNIIIVYILNMMFQCSLYILSIMLQHCAIAQCICAFWTQRSTSLSLWHNLAHFRIPYLCLLNPSLTRPSQSSNQGQFLYKSWSQSQTPLQVTCTYLLVYIKSDSIHSANGSEQLIELHILRHQVAQ